MLKNGVPTCKTAAEAQDRGVIFGAAHERRWLDEFFRVPGGPPGKAYYMPATAEWVQERYPDRTLQRRRKDFEDSIFFHPARETWAIREGAAPVAAQRWLAGNEPIPVVALMAWMWRDREIPALPEAVADFIKEFGLDRDGFVGTLYDARVTDEFLTAGLATDRLAPEEISDLTGAIPPAPPSPSLKEMVDHLESVLNKSNFSAPPGLVERIVGGWLVQDIVVLVGATGSGKTSLTRHLASGLRDQFGDDRFSVSFLEVTPQYDLAQFLGYENLAGAYTRGAFADEVLFVGTPTDPRLVVLDEWNLAQIDSYFAPVLSAMETRLPLHLPGRLSLTELGDADRFEITRAQPEVSDGRCFLPEDTFFIATCNSWQEEPESRLPISGPVKRRCRIIAMPNVLEDVLKRGGRQGLVDFADVILKQEAAVLRGRADAGRSSILDRHRMERLSQIAAVSKLPDQVQETLLRICQVLLGNASSKAGFTPGILKDLLLSVVYAPEGNELGALGHAVADKVLHQLQGDPQILRLLLDQVRDLPNAEEISDLMKRMDGGGTERRIRSLV